MTEFGRRIKKWLSERRKFKVTRKRNLEVVWKKAGKIVQKEVNRDDPEKKKR